MKEKVDEMLIKRAAELWGRKLYTPVFDNGDDSLQGALTAGLASMNIDADKEGINNMPKRIEVFKKVLFDNLVNAQNDDNQYLDRFLSVDYGPCKSLADAADTAGIPYSQFSVKSTVYINAGYVSTSFGYGAEDVNHYPIPDGRWLMTTLRGSDMDKVIKHVINDNSMGFDIE